MFCKNCGKHIEYDSVYCDECKIKLVFKDGRFIFVDENNKEVEVKKYE